MANYFGIDLAWGEGTATRTAKETGVALLRDDGSIADAGWTTGIAATTAWIVDRMTPGDVIAIDAPLVVTNATGMRECERQVGQRYGRWQVSANSTNLTRTWFGGITIRQQLQQAGVVYDDSVNETWPDSISMFECYPYTTLVGAHEFGYEIERPRYKRPNTAQPTAERRSARAAACDDLIRRMASLALATPRLDLLSHPHTTALLAEPSPLDDRSYKHREDLIDAVLSAWTAALWANGRLERCQVLGSESAPDEAGRRPVIIAPARAEQRR